MYNLRQQNTTGYIVAFPMFDSITHTTEVTGKVPSVRISKNGSSFTVASGSVSEIGSGWYRFGFTAQDTSTLGELVFRAEATGCDTFVSKYTIVPFNPFDSVRLGLSSLPNFSAGSQFGLTTNNLNVMGSVASNISTTGFNAAAGLSSSDGFYIGSVLVFNSGSLLPVARRITGYVGATRTFALSSALPANPSSGDTFTIIGRIE